MNNRGKTALWFACCDGQENFVETLLLAGADPNVADQYGDSCLHAAIHGLSSTKTIQKILDHGAHVNAVDNDGATPLLLACISAQTESVELLLTSGADPNIADADGDTSIIHAIEANCRVNTVQNLIDNGAKVNATNNRGSTALIKACSYSQMDVVKVLLEAGADPTIADDVQYSSLHAAVDGRCSKDTLKALIDHGAFIDATRKDGTSALLCACSTAQDESVMLLLKAGADVNITKPDGNTCLHVAVKGKCCKEALQMIIDQGINVNTLNNRGETALLLACESAQAESVNLLLEKGGDPNISYADGYTSLHAAVYGGCTNETLQEIISHKVYLDAQNIDGETALWLACFYGKHDSVKILLEAGSNPNISSTDKHTSLHAAVKGCCSKSIISAILDHGADENATNKYHNETSLLLACVRGNTNAINVLLNVGADPNIADAYGDTCLHYAASRDCSKEVLQAIISHDGDVNATNANNVTVLMKACAERNKDVINVFLNAGADPSVADAAGDTWFHYAAQNHRHPEVLQAIISHGVDLNATNKKNVTALMKGCKKGNKEVINVLLNAGADPNIADANGDTWFHYAAQNKKHPEVLQGIISQGVDVHATNKNDVTALMLACINGNIDDINVLLNAGADPNTVDAHGSAWFTYAARNDCFTYILQAIICHGVDVNAIDKCNTTALMIACKEGNKDDISVLLNAGADPNIADVYGDTWFDYAAQNCRHPEVLQAIISHGVDVNATNKKHVTVLMKACANGIKDAINVLINAGVDPKVADTNSDTCTWLHCAARNKWDMDVV